MCLHPQDTRPVNAPNYLLSVASYFNCGYVLVANFRSDKVAQAELFLVGLHIHLLFCVVVCVSLEMVSQQGYRNRKRNITKYRPDKRGVVSRFSQPAPTNAVDVSGLTVRTSTL